MRIRTAFTIVAVGLYLSAAAPGAAQCEPAPGANHVTPVAQVVGKEYSHNMDTGAAGAADPLQNVWFTGTGPTEADDVDALANSQDAYFWDVATDLVPMVVSLQAHGTVHYQTAQVNTTGLWATQGQINSTSPPADVDALELWGAACDETAGADDAIMFSLVGDPGGWAVLRYDPVQQTTTGYVTTQQLQLAVSGPDLDLDALMVWDSEDNGVWDMGDAMIFSVKAGYFDGGEVWLWRYGQGWANFMTHGGLRWDTAHAVGVSILGAGTEEVVALEALPEPTTLLLLATGALAALRRRRHGVRARAY